MHDYRNCSANDCDECQHLVDIGHVISCDECHEPGASDSEGWTRDSDDRTLCNHCIDKPEPK